MLIALFAALQPLEYAVNFILRKNLIGHKTRKMNSLKESCQL
jgi:hypothetical protein